MTDKVIEHAGKLLTFRRFNQQDPLDVLTMSIIEKIWRGFSNILLIKELVFVKRNDVLRMRALLKVKQIHVNTQYLKEITPNRREQEIADGFLHEYAHLIHEEFSGIPMLAVKRKAILKHRTRDVIGPLAKYRRLLQNLKENLIVEGFACFIEYLHDHAEFCAIGKKDEFESSVQNIAKKAANEILELWEELISSWDGKNRILAKIITSFRGRSFRSLERRMKIAQYDIGYYLLLTVSKSLPKSSIYVLAEISSTKLIALYEKCEKDTILVSNTSGKGIIDFKRMTEELTKLQTGKIPKLERITKK